MKRTFLLSPPSLALAALAGGRLRRRVRRRPAAARRAPRRRRQGPTKLSLVAYSTPQVVYDEIIPDFQKTAAGKGVGVQDVLRRVGRPEPRGRGRPAGRRRRVLARARRRPPRRGRARRRRLGRATPTQGPRHRLGRLVHRAQGQPEEHQDLGRPAQARRQGRHAEPVHLGRGEVEPAWPPTAPATAARLEAASRTCASCSPSTSGPAQVRPRGAADLHRRQGRRAHLLRERGHDRPEEGRGRRLRHPRRHDPDREPDRGHQDRSTPAQAKAFVDYALSQAGAAAASPTGATARSTRRCCEANKAQVPDAARRSSRSSDLGGWSKVNDELFDPEKGSVAKIEEDAGVSTAK